MPAKIVPNLKDVSETMLITLHVRAVESQRPDAMLKDEKAVSMVEQLDYDFSRIKLQKHDQVGVIMRMRKFDRLTRDFMAHNPRAVVIHIGCGLDTRFDRVDDGRVEWFDLDLPPVIELRRRLFGEDRSRHHYLSGSIFEVGWIEAVGNLRDHPFLFVAEGVLPYFEEAQVRALILGMRDHFPGAELVCDAHTPLTVWTDNFQLALSGMRARLRWGLKHGRDVEGWGGGISLLDEWFFFEDPEPRMQAYRWMRFIPLLGKSTGIFHYRLGTRI